MAGNESANQDLQKLKSDLQNHLEKPLVKGDTWFLVDNKWFKQVKIHVGLEEARFGNHHPGPVNTKNLFKEDGSDIKEHMIDELDYVLVPEEAWVLLVDKFGIGEGQKSVKRKVVEHGMFSKHRSVEVYYTGFELAHEINMEDTRKRKFSKSDSIEQIQDVMKEEFGISAERETRLWIKYTSNTYKLLDKLDRTVQEAGFFSGSKLIIEIKNDDGTWPRGQAGSFRLTRVDTSSVVVANETHIVRVDTSKLKQIVSELENIQAFESRMEDTRKSLEKKHKTEMTRVMERQKQELKDYEKDCASNIRKKKDLINELQSALSPSAPSAPVPECPVCMDSMAPPTRIFNCPNGHLVCGVCKPKVPECNLCRKDYIGRATAMEQMLRDIFKYQ